MKNLYTLVMCFFFLSLQAQDYYYNGGEKVKIYKSDKSFIAFETPNQTVTMGFENVKTFSTKGFTILEDKKVNFSTREFERQNLNQITPALLLKMGGDFKMFPTKTIRVKLKPNTSVTQVTRLFSKGDVFKIDEKFGILRIIVHDINKVLEIANKIYESDVAEFSIPDFYIPLELNQVNDPLFPLQFQMHNTGQVIDGVAGVNNIDCNALQAWDISLGNNVTVAVFDQGLENHEDFGNRLIGGFTPATNGNGTPLLNGDTHGMNCAGVIGASDDNLGLRGIAPNVNFLSVNIFANGTTSGDIADGIQWAINNGADVLSNSWSYPLAPCDFTNIDIENAIQNAVTNGRNGRGSVVVFSSGNTGGCVNYPARNNNVISVGAVDNRGNLFNYSARGPELDLVAPSGQTNYLGNIRTTDRMGIAGRVAGNYEPSFGGTSASCPVVSGVAALVLSVNPNLTQQEVRNILTSTATDMGTGGFDNNFGFGRVNAFAAVQAAQIDSIDGPDIICYSPNSTFYLQNGGSSVTWWVSSNLQVISSNNTSITVKPIDSTVIGEGFIEAVLFNKTLRKNVWVGVPSVPSSILGFCCNGMEFGSESIYEFTVDPENNSSVNQFNWVVAGGNILEGQGTNTIFVKTSKAEGSQVIYFDVSVRVGNNCGWSSYLWRSGYVTSGVGPAMFSVYPNPANYEVTISVADIQVISETDATNEVISVSEVKIYDFFGTVKKVKKTNSNQKSITINVTDLQKGTYLILINSGTITESHKLIIE